MNKVAVGLINSTATILLQYHYSTATVPFVSLFCKTCAMLKKKKKKKKKSVKTQKTQRNANPNTH